MKRKPIVKKRKPIVKKKTGNKAKIRTSSVDITQFMGKWKAWQDFLDHIGAFIEFMRWKQYPYLTDAESQAILRILQLSQERLLEQVREAGRQ